MREVTLNELYQVNGGNYYAGREIGAALGMLVGGVIGMGMMVASGDFSYVLDVGYGFSPGFFLGTLAGAVVAFPVIIGINLIN